MNAIERELHEIEICLVPPMRLVMREQSGFTPEGFRFFIDYGDEVIRCFVQTTIGGQRWRIAKPMPTLGNAEK